MGRKPWSELAKGVGVPDTRGFRACMADPATLAAIERDMAAGRKLRVDGTPTFLINDLKVVGYPGPGALRTLVESEFRNSQRRSGS